MKKPHTSEAEYFTAAEQLSQYLQGFSSGAPSKLRALALSDWQQAARAELRWRQASFVRVLDYRLLEQLADGSLDLAATALDLARRLEKSDKI